MQNDPSSDNGQLLAEITVDTLPMVYDRFAAVMYSAALRMTENEEYACSVLSSVLLDIQKPGKRYTADQGRPLLWLLSRVHAASCVLLKDKVTMSTSGTDADRSLYLLFRCYALDRTDDGTQPKARNGKGGLYRSIKDLPR